MRRELAPVAALKQLQIVDAMPKMRQGKILRIAIGELANGQQFAVPATIENPAALFVTVQSLGGAR